MKRDQGGSNLSRKALIIGVSLLGLGLLLLYAPFIHALGTTFSVVSAQAECNKPLGRVVQLFSTSLNSDCKMVATGYMVGVILVISGTLASVLGFIGSLIKRR